MNTKENGIRFRKEFRELTVMADRLNKKSSISISQEIQKAIEDRKLEPDDHEKMFVLE